jgi:signal transduction histidine kinase
LPADLPGREIISPMLARIDTLNQTVKDILTYSKPSAPKLQRFAIQPLLADVATTVRASSPQFGRIEVNGEPIMVFADIEMTRAVLVNLLLNACQASAPQTVELRAAVAHERCRVEVLDRGPGLPAEVRGHMYEPFVTTRSSGTGLGLPIAHRLTTIQGGTLSIDDRPAGGTVATVTLPLA